MKISTVDMYDRGWFIGNFSPALVQNVDFEICLKVFEEGDSEIAAFQKVATEVTLVVSGEIQINGVRIGSGGICLVEPGETADFIAITRSTVIGIKFPSIKDDKVILGED